MPYRSHGRNHLLTTAILSTGFASIAVHPGAEASCPTPYVPTGSNFGTVSLTSYYNINTCSGTISSNGSSTSVTMVHSGTISNGSTIVCAKDVNLAMTCAGEWFYANSDGYVLSIPAGTFAVPDVSPTGAGIFTLPATNGSLTSPPNSYGLIIEGAGSSGSTVTLFESNYELATITGFSGTAAPISNVTIENIVFDRDQFAAYQGLILSVGSITETLSSTTTFTAINKSTLPSSSVTNTITPQTFTASTLSILVPEVGKPGFNRPTFPFDTSNFTLTPAQGGFLGYLGDQRYIRLYKDSTVSNNGTTVVTPSLEAGIVDSNGTTYSTSQNYQVYVRGFCKNGTNTVYDQSIYDASDPTAPNPTVSGTITTLVTSNGTFACPAAGSSGTTYTLILGFTPGTYTASDNAAISFYQVAPSGDIVCGKNEGFSGYFGFVDESSASSTATNFNMQNVALMGSGLTYLAGISDINLENLSIGREAPQSIAGTLHSPCLSTDAGGPQIGAGTTTTSGNTITNFKATATGDDSLAIFNDVGGLQTSSTGTTFAHSSVTNAVISDSFARGVLINPPSETLYFGGSPIDMNYLSNVNVYPYVGFLTSTPAGSECLNNNVVGTENTATADQGFPANGSNTCSFSGSSSWNTISNIYVNCLASTDNSTADFTFCPVLAYPQ